MNIRFVASVVAALSFAVIVTGCDSQTTMERPAELDLATERPTEAGLYRVRYVPANTPVPTNVLHSWTIEVATADGVPVTDARITVDGGMPEHGHGLPTQPQVAPSTGNGSFLVEGMKFNMPGWWTVKVTVDGTAGDDFVIFNLSL